MTSSTSSIESGPSLREAATPTRRRRVGPVVAASLGAGLATAAVFALVVFPGAEEHVITGTGLLAFAFGWALLAAGSARWTDQAQLWAAVPATLMGLAGAGLLIFAPGPSMLQTLGWVWPPALLALVAWMTLHARRQLRSRTRRWLLYPVFGVLTLVALGGTFETARESLNRAALPVGGRLVDVGDHRLYLHCSGSGSPVVLLEAGLGANSSAWKTIEHVVARQTRVCSYDRAGRGRSEDATGTQDGIQTTNDLHTLLARSGEPGPYVLVGHSLGGAYVLDFAQQFPTQVAGIALIDSMSPDQFTRVAGYATFYDVLHRVSGLLPSVARVGVGRILGYDARDAGGFRDDVAEIPAALKQARALKSLGGVPLIVVTAPEGQQAGWASGQDELATLSTNSVHRIVPGATHDSLVDDRADAAQSSRAIRDVVRATRTGEPISAQTTGTQSPLGPNS
jgi:pimeloyl-ACP methyl ester carboxylesterase